MKCFKHLNVDVNWDECKWKGEREWMSEWDKNEDSGCEYGCM